jgi:hypothetical protein
MITDVTAFDPLAASDRNFYYSSLATGHPPTAVIAMGDPVRSPGL